MKKKPEPGNKVAPLRDVGAMGNEPTRPYLEGIADWIRHDFEVDVAPVPAAIADALTRLSEAEKERASAPGAACDAPGSLRSAGVR